MSFLRRAARVISGISSVGSPRLNFTHTTTAAKNVSYVMGARVANTLTDTPSQMRVPTLGLGLPRYFSSSSSREYFSWLDHCPEVPDIQIQGDNPTCQCYSIITATEWAYRIHTGLDLVLSTKELVDAGSLHGQSVKDLDDRGSRKKRSKRAGPQKFRYFTNEFSVAEWIEQNGVCLAGDYPNQVEQKIFPKYHHLRSDFHFDSGRDDGSQFMKAILRQPIIVGLEIDFEAFSQYRRGFYREEKKMDDFTNQSLQSLKSNTTKAIAGHSVVAIGWTRDDRDEPYLQIQNCWGKRWGDQGYGYVHYSSCVSQFWATIPIVMNGQKMNAEAVNETIEVAALRCSPEVITRLRDCSLDVIKMLNNE